MKSIISRYEKRTMYHRGRRGEPREYEDVDAYAEGDYEPDSIGSDADEISMEQAEYAGEEERENDAYTGMHLQPTTFQNRQFVILDIEFTGSPEQFEAGTAETSWKLAGHLPKHLKQIMTTTNRDRATDEDLAGNVRLGVPLSFQVIQQQNTQPWAAGIKARSGLLPRNLSRHDAYLWRVPAATNTMAVKMERFWNLQMSLIVTRTTMRVFPPKIP